MGEAKIPSLLWKFSLPATVGMLVQALYNIVDRIFVGNAPDIGANGLAGITIVFPIYMILMAVSLLCGVGASALYAISLGERDYERADKILGNAFLLGVIFSAVIGIFFYIFSDPILRAFGTSDEIMPFATSFLHVTLLGSIFVGINMTGNNLIRADGSPGIAMLTIIIGSIINVILNPIFIYVLHWGIAGSAWASIIGQFCSSIWIIYYFTKGKSNTKLRLHHFKPDLFISTKIILIGLPAFFIQAAGSILNIFLNIHLVDQGGDLAISAMGVVTSVATLLSMPIIGINQGSLPIIGFNYGANKIDRVKETLKFSILAATIIALIGWIATQFFSYQIIQLFTPDQELINMGAEMVRIWFFAWIVVGYSMVGSNYFQALGKVAAAITLTISRQILILIPLISILSRIYGFYGILAAAPISDTLSAVLVSIMLFISLRKLKETRIENQDKPYSALD